MSLAGETFEQYEAACAACEKWRSLSEAQHAEVIGLLAYDKHKSSGSSRGLSLKADFPALNLRKWDRVEAHANMPDPADIFSLTEFPARVLFWRVSDETMVRRRNPLFNQAIGFTVDRVTGLDWLHCLSLGCFQTYCSYAVHRLLQCDAWGSGEANMTCRMNTSLGERLSVQLDAWLKGEKRKGRKVTDFTILPDTFGTLAKPLCSLKGGETNWLLEFLVRVELPRVGAAIGPDFQALVKAGECLMELLCLIRKHDVTFPTRDIQAFHFSAKLYLHIMSRTFGLVPKPKDHMLIHMSLRIRFMGSPSLYSNWLDESLNALLREVAAGAHSTVHDKRVLAEFPLALEKQDAKCART